jgi:hypothetical protein
MFREGFSTKLIEIVKQAAALRIPCSQISFFLVFKFVDQLHDELIALAEAHSVSFANTLLTRQALVIFGLNGLQGNI